MSYTEKDCLNAKHSTVQQRRRTKRASESEPQPVQVIHQIIIPETPAGLVGQKVVYNERCLKMKAKHGWNIIPLPPRGYFTILRAVLEDDGHVTVRLSDHENRVPSANGTHICVCYLKPYKDND